MTKHVNELENLPTPSSYDMVDMDTPHDDNDECKEFEDYDMVTPSEIDQLRDELEKNALEFEPATQFDRDIALITAAINQPGADPFSATLLKKLYTLLHFGNLHYKRDDKWHPWDMPLAAAICHGARITVQFPDELSESIHAWLFADIDDLSPYKRLAASHDVEECKEDCDPVKIVREVKLKKAKNALFIGQELLTRAVESAPYWGKRISKEIVSERRLYGINLALGGDGEICPFGKNEIIQNDGGNGHLYLEVHTSVPGTRKGALLFGIEQSAPHVESAHGFGHGASATHHAFTATNGTDFAREEEGTQNPLISLGTDTYYDGMFFKHRTC